MIGKIKPVWLRGVDLNHRPLGYEFSMKSSFNELAGVVACFKDWKIRDGRPEEFLFWVGFGLNSKTFLISHVSCSYDLRDCRRGRGNGVPINLKMNKFSK